MKNICISLGEHVVDVINFEKKKMLPLTEKELKSHQNSTVCIIFWGKKYSQKLVKDKNNRKVRDHCHFTGKYRGAASNKMLIVFHNGSDYDYHFAMKELANDFKSKFICLGENTEKYKTFSVPIEKETKKVAKHGN